MLPVRHGLLSHIYEKDVSELSDLIECSQNRAHTLHLQFEFHPHHSRSVDAPFWQAIHVLVDSFNIDVLKSLTVLFSHKGLSFDSVPSQLEIISR